MCSWGAEHGPYHCHTESRGGEGEMGMREVSMAEVVMDGRREKVQDIGGGCGR